MTAHETDWKALGLPNPGPCFNWRVRQEPKPETRDEAVNRRFREAYAAGSTAKQRRAAKKNQGLQA